MTFDLRPRYAAGLRRFFYSQALFTVPAPTASFQGKTVII